MARWFKRAVCFCACARLANKEKGIRKRSTRKAIGNCFAGMGESKSNNPFHHRFCIKFFCTLLIYFVLKNGGIFSKLCVTVLLACTNPFKMGKRRKERALIFISLKTFFGLTGRAIFAFRLHRFAGTCGFTTTSYWCTDRQF